MTRLAGALLPLALVAACSGSSSTAAPGTSVAPSPTAASVPTCDAFFSAGAILPNDADARCLDSDGTVVVHGTYTCADGRHLLGDARGWGFTGEAVHLEAAASSPAYKAAYTACNG